VGYHPHFVDVLFFRLFHVLVFLEGEEEESVLLVGLLHRLYGELAPYEEGLNHGGKDDDVPEGHEGIDPFLLGDAGGLKDLVHASLLLLS